ncbi:MAG: hypothetical protein ACR2IK_03890 [Chloroflexota bacterium]
MRISIEFVNIVQRLHDTRVFDSTAVQNDWQSGGFGGQAHACHGNPARTTPTAS